MTTYVHKLDPADAEKEILDDRRHCYDARRVTTDGNDLIVIVYGGGPTQHMNMVTEAIDNLETE